jgi:hypothetical protein
MREAWPYADAHRFLVFDHDSKFGNDVVSCAKDMGSEPLRTAFRSPWQNGVAERWIGSCRRDLLDHVIVFNERHLKRLMSEYVRYYHEDRTHLGLSKDAPTGRPVAIRSAGNRIQSFSRLGGCTIVTWSRRRGTLQLRGNPSRSFLLAFQWQKYALCSIFSLANDIPHSATPGNQQLRNGQNPLREWSTSGFDDPHEDLL